MTSAEAFADELRTLFTEGAFSDTASEQCLRVLDSRLGQELPAGVETQLHYYATSEDGINVRIILGGKIKNEAVHDMAGLEEGIAGFISSLNEQYGKGWRAMTREEILEYKASED